MLPLKIKSAFHSIQSITSSQALLKLFKIGSCVSKNHSLLPMAPRKKKATTANPSPSAKRQRVTRSMSLSVVREDVEMSGTTENEVQSSSGSSRSRDPICPKEKKTKDLNTWDRDQCEAWFAEYCSMDPDVIDPEGFQKLLEQLGVDIFGIIPLVIAFHLGSTKLFYIQREEWIDGMRALKIDSLEKLKTFLPVMDAYVSDLCSETTFFELYHWAFLYIKDDDDKKSVDIDNAIAVLNVLLEPRGSKQVGPFTQFLAEAKPVKSLNKDQWHLFYEFSQTNWEDFSNYDANGAWPNLFDEYVEWCRARKQIDTGET